MHKPFKKTHWHNEKEWRWCTIQTSRGERWGKVKERGFAVLIWLDKEVDVKLMTQHSSVMFLPFWFYILQYMWWVGNKTWKFIHWEWNRRMSGRAISPPYLHSIGQAGKTDAVYVLWKHQQQSNDKIRLSTRLIQNIDAVFSIELVLQSPACSLHYT